MSINYFYKVKIHNHTTEVDFIGIIYNFPVSLTYKVDQQSIDYHLSQNKDTNHSIFFIFSY